MEYDLTHITIEEARVAMSEILLDPERTDKSNARRGGQSVCVYHRGDPPPTTNEHCAVGAWMHRYDVPNSVLGASNGAVTSGWLLRTGISVNSEVQNFLAWVQGAADTNIPWGEVAQQRGLA